MTNAVIQAYLKKTNPEKINAGFLAYISSLEAVASVAPDISRSIVSELRDQRSNLKLIASENYCSLPTQLAMGNLMTDKYAEGYPYHRFYAGCDNVDAIEAYAAQEAVKLFGCDHAYVQPHSGADANLIAYWAILSAKVKEPVLAELGVKDLSALSRQDWDNIRTKLGNQKLLGLDYYSGGHLTHGYRHNVSAQMFDAYSYGVSRETGLLDYDEIERMTMEIKPLILLAGYSAYPRAINFARMREMADKVNAVLMVDMAHFAGLVAGGVFKGEYNPVKYAHIVTSTTHKTLRGPRGGIVLCTSEFAEHVDKGCPLVIGGPLPHVMAAKGVAFTEANSEEYKQYAANIADNAKTLAEACIAEGMTIATDGTENHLLLIDVRPFGLSGRQAENAMRQCGITLNRNSLPYDPNGPWYTSGLRIGTPAVTTLGMGRKEMLEIAAIIKFILSSTKASINEKTGEPSKAKYEISESAVDKARNMVEELLDRYPVYPELDLEFLMEHFV